MNATLQTVDGRKVKTATRRRYVLIGSDKHDVELYIDRRSDSRETLIKAAYGRKGPWWIGDTTTGAATRLFR